MKNRETFEDLREICQSDKLKENTGWTLANRKVSLVFSRWLIRFGVTANQASVLSILTGIAAALFFLGGSFVLNLVAILLLYVSLTLDQIDGELARYYDTVSLNGVYIDELRHLLIYAVPLYFLSIAPSVYFEIFYFQIFGFIAALIVNLIRVEDRLPLLIYTDRVLLKNNFTKGSLSQVKDPEEPAGEKEVGSTSQSKIKVITKPIYTIFSMMSDQVSILFFLFIISIGDFVLLMFLGVNFLLQTTFVFSFSILGSFVFFRTCFSHWKESWAIETCKEIEKRFD